MRYIRLKTLADELGKKLFPVSRAVKEAGITIHRVRVDGQWRHAITEADARAWKKARHTPNVT